MIHSSRSSPALNHKQLIHTDNALETLDANTQQQQPHEINQYLIKLLAKKINELQDYESKIKKIKHFANSDVEQLVDSLLHNMNDTDKEMYKTGAKFMKHTVTTILSE
jgi:hypothetical protein